MRISDWSSDVCSSDLQQLWKARKFLKANHIEFQPGVNEDLAATAVWGSQQLNLFPGANYDGVYSIWYGKGPGVDRSMDVFKHGNSAGTSQHGGVLALCGDDHGAASSTVAHQRSEERRVGKGWVSTCRSRWAPEP